MTENGWDAVFREVYPRFAKKIDFSGSCWVWCGGNTPEGYGRFRSGGRMTGAHRFALECTGVDVASAYKRGLVIDHACNNPPCVNPAHLRLMTYSENLLRSGLYGTKTHCKNGHERNKDNWVTPLSGTRHRPYCRACVTERSRARRRKAREASHAEA